MIMEVNMILCLLVLLAPACSCVRLQLQGRLFINSPENYRPAERLPFSFIGIFDWINLKTNMTDSWREDQFFHTSVMVDKDRCTGDFRGTQTPCYRNGTFIDCHLDAMSYKNEVMIYLGYKIYGSANVSFSFRGRPNRRLNKHNGIVSRDSMQILWIGRKALPRNLYMNFTFRIRCQSCYIAEDQIALLAYQARYSPPGCRSWEAEL